LPSLHLVAGGLLLAATIAGPVPTRYERSEARHELPAVTLTDAAGQAVPLARALAPGGPVLLQFLFTTCTTVCPTLAATFSAVQKDLGDARLVSITIDPETDTPARLREYAARFAAGPRWSFLTGRLEDVVAVERAFDVDRGNKMSHPPAIFLRAGASSWVRLDGYPSAADLRTEVARLPAPVTGEGGDPGLGRRLYRDGILPSGEPLSGRLAGDVPARGAAVACANCHRPSGYGGVEGSAYVPPVTGPSLFAALGPRRIDLFETLFQESLEPSFWRELRERASRPPYDEASLAAALRDGVDPLGRLLHPLMPRYRLSDDEVAHLAAYLRTLAVDPAPGVDDRTIRFATVVATGAEPAPARAQRELIDAYVRFHNANVERWRSKQGRLPWEDEQKVSTYRLWQVETWSLMGPPETWREQLDRHQRERPVFALLAGLGPREPEGWRPVHTFCEAEEMPCLFPETDLPPQEPGRYDLYWSRGLALEADALAHQLRIAGPSGERPRIIQVYREDTPGEAAAQAFRSAWDGAVESFSWGAAGQGWRGLAARLAEKPEPAVLVLWLGGADLAGLAGFASVATDHPAPGDRVSRVYLSSALAGGEPPPLPSAWRDRAFALLRVSLPGKEPPHAYRVHAWMNARGVARGDERTQLDTYFLLTALDDALARMVDHFSRDLLIEVLERELESDFNPGVYPHLALGPGQRFASKGCYVVKLAPGQPGGVEGKGDWVVP
jgi:cytochrome oxidase Cu insertion factor (SCO1/SenC/PrrC family)